MNIEHANLRARTGVPAPPTASEFALARSRGKNTISTEELRAMRAEARRGKASSSSVPLVPVSPTAPVVVPRVAQGSSASADALALAKAKRRLEKLKNENTRLKVALMAAK